MLSAAVIEHASLEEVNIFFDTATYDEIEKDVRVKQNSVGSVLWGNVDMSRYRQVDDIQHVFT